MADDAREQARERLEAKRGFVQTVVTAGIIAVVLIVIWALTGADGFWPIWPILGMGIGVSFKAFNTFGRRPVTDADVDREMRREQGGAS